LAAAPAFADYRAIMTALPEVLKEVYGSADVSKQDENYVRYYNRYILDGIDGLYVPISLLGIVDAAKFKQACDGPVAVRIARQGDYRFTFTENASSPAPVDYVYVYRLGNTFSFSADPDKLLKAHGLPPDDARAAPTIASQLFAASGIATVSKTADMLVFQRNFAKPVVYARCD
jgi:hypothetical protein